MRPVGLLIGGDRITSTESTHEHIFPATGRPNATVALAGAAEIDRAVASACEAQREWVSLTVDRRRDLMIDLADVVHDHLDELAALNVQDYRGTDLLRRHRAYAGDGSCGISPATPTRPHGSSTPVSGSFDVNLVEREPYGVVGVIAPWNGSLAVAGSCVAPALAAGNAVVFETIRARAVAAVALRRAVPRGRAARRVWSTWCLPAAGGRRRAGAPSGNPQGALHRWRRHRPRGDPLGRRTNLTPVVAELGGKSANIVFGDADLDHGRRCCRRTRDR